MICNSETCARCKQTYCVEMTLMPHSEVEDLCDICFALCTRPEYRTEEQQKLAELDPLKDDDGKS